MARDAYINDEFGVSRKNDSAKLKARSHSSKKDELDKEKLASGKRSNKFEAANEKGKEGESKEGSKKELNIEAKKDGLSSSKKELNMENKKDS